MLFRFAHPWVFVALLIPALLLARYVWVWRPGHGSGPMAGRAALAFADTRLVEAVGSGWRARLVGLPDTLRWAAWLLLLIAAARPQMGQAREVIRGQGIDIVLVLDISTSMAALDFEPQDRLTAAKTVIGDFIDGREFDRIGLVVFAREAFQQSPLTLDYPVLRSLLDQVQLVNAIVDADGLPLLLDGTAIGLGIVSAAQMLRDSQASSRVIIVLTDGGSNAALDPVTAAQAASVLGMRVYTVGMGRTGQIPVPGPDGEIVFVESDLNEDGLRQIAEAADGLYFRAEDTDGLRRTYAQIDALERSPVERRVVIPWQDQAAGWLLGGLALLIAEMLLRRTLLQTIP